MVGMTLSVVFLENLVGIGPCEIGIPTSTHFFSTPKKEKSIGRAGPHKSTHLALTIDK
jgi:hypothetical protein